VLNSLTRPDGLGSRLAPLARGATRLFAVGLLLSLVRVVPLAFGQGAPAPSGAATGDPAAGYMIGPGDVLHLFVWKEPELTRDVTVRMDGKVTIPLLGEVQATGKRPGDLAIELTTRLKAYLAAPQVTVMLVESHAARFFVLGQVLRSGEFPLEGRTTLLQALAMAGGFKEFAKTDEIVIVRQTGRGEAVIEANYKRIESGRDITQNVVIRPGDTILVP
jgi:polysaccharide export outer membrane protein